MSCIDKVFEAGSWDVSLPPSPTPPSNAEQEQGAPPLLSLAMGSSTILPCPSPITSPINRMSDTPSTQSTRPADIGTKKNFVWQAQDIEHLVDMIYINKSYQHTILLSEVVRLRPGTGGSTGAILVSSNRSATIELCDSYRIV
ncbi:uncharacterized protein UHOD_12069 [Ustilago sp. UG-2017b]|nr:uncharacterized protein UHOD_12069 [Ustilago sp. UG-2017b]